jgi:hypothetical protein
VGASLADAEIGDAGTRTDVPKAKKRLSWIEKRLEALGGELAGARLAVVQHAGEVESAFAVARQRGHEAREVQEANAQDLGELQELEGRIAAVRYRIQNREALGELVGLIGVGGIG